MTLDQARQALTDHGPGTYGVVYRPRPAVCEQGVITSVGAHWVFVRYAGDVHAKATDAAMLEPLAVDSLVQP